ncbi:MAG: MFS transporter [Geminicoccaceae bacterium]
MTVTSSALQRSAWPWAFWMIVLSSGAIVGLTGGMRQATALYMPPVTMSLGISVASFSNVLAVSSLLWGLSSIVAGALADRYGAARIAAVGIALMALGYYAMSAAAGSADLMPMGICLGLGAGCTSTSVMVGAVGRVASPADRPVAIAAISIANGIGGFILFPYVHLFISTLDWQGAALACIATLAALLPMATILFRYEKKPSVARARSQSFGAAMKEAAMLPSYWLLVFGFFICGFHVSFYASHLPNYTVTLGLESWVGMAALSAVGAANILGTWLSGLWGRHLQQRRGLIIVYLGRSLVFVGFLVLPINAWVLIGLSALLGLFWLATVPLTSGLVATLFGTTWLSTLYGTVFFAHQLGAFFGVWMGGVVFDATTSYEVMWWISIALGMVAALLHWPIHEAPVLRLTQEAA